MFSSGFSFQLNHYAPLPLAVISERGVFRTVRDLVMMGVGFGSCAALFHTATILSGGCKYSRELGKSKVEYWFWTTLYYASIVLALCCAAVGIRGLLPLLAF